MAIKESEVKVTLCSSTIGYFEELGYKIPRVKSYGRKVVPRGTQILVKIEHLNKGSSARLTKVCDRCGAESLNQEYRSIINLRVNKEDLCVDCGYERMAEVKRVPPPEKSLATLHPDLAKEIIDGNASEIFANSHQVFNWKCKNCGNEWSAKVKDRSLSCSGCPTCAPISRGEEKIKEILLQNNLEFFHNKPVFESLRSKNGRLLRPDFYIPSQRTAIEYDGLQHFKPIKHFGGEKQFKSLIENDSIKDNFFRTNGVKLLRISYKEESQIEQILKKEGVI